MTKKKKENKRQENKKQDINDYNNIRLKKILKIIGLICLGIILIEGILFVIMQYQREQNTTYYEAFSMVDVDGEDRIIAGSSDFRYSSKYDYTNGIEKGRLAKYDKDNKLLWEVMYDDGQNSSFSAVKKIDDGYLVAGSAELTDYEKENNIREALFIKYDLEGNKVWEKHYKTLSDSKFLDILVEDDGYVVIGQSIYENLEIGNHTTGGGIIVKYDLNGEEVWASNYGGNKSGIFSAIAKAKGGYVVVGRDSKDTGITVFYDEKGNRKWVRNYSYTDSDGFKDVIVKDDSIYVFGSKKIWTDTGDADLDAQRNTTNTDALVVKYNTDGKLLFEKSFGGSNYERYQSAYLVEDTFYVVGHFTSHDGELENPSDEEDEMTGLIVKMDLNGEILDKKAYGGKNDDNILYLTIEEDHLLAVGHSRSNDHDLAKSGHNGKDYQGWLFTLDK